MKHTFVGSLTTALVLASLAVPLPGKAQQIEAQDRSTQTESFDDSTLQARSSAPAGSNFLEISDDSIVRVYPHVLNGRPAATLYVHNLPVLTFLGDEASAATKQIEAPSSPSSVHLEDVAVAPGVPAESASPPEPVRRAIETGTQINQLVHDGTDPELIQARWNAETEQYEITVADAPLLAMNDGTILANTTGESAADALQATNRLRRLLGGAEPLETITGQPQPQPEFMVASTTQGMASWYGPGFHGRRSASGEVFNQYEMTAAHRTLPFGTQVRVTNLQNNQQVVVRITDRGPYGHGRVIDLSAGAAQAIGLRQMGVGPVRLEVLTP